MELIELIGKITNFKKRFSQLELFRDACYVSTTKQYKIHTTKMQRQIESEIDIINNELEGLKTLDNVEYQNIVNTHLPTFIKTLKTLFFQEHYVVGASIIEKHIEQNNGITISKLEHDVEIFNDTYKIKLLSELGILNFLKTEFPKCKENNAEISRVLFRICGFKTEEKKTIEKYISEFNKKLDLKKEVDADIKAFVDKLK